MIGLTYLAAGAVYLVITVWLVKWAARAAAQRGIAGWKWGLPVVLVMYLLVFWDWIPTLVVHKYYCSKHAGFTVYKTLDEWKQENPGVAETLVPMEGADSTRAGDKTTYQLNERFAWDVRYDELLLGIKKTDYKVVDRGAGEVLAEYIDFSTNLQPIGLGVRSVRDLKLWLRRPSCEPESNQVKRVKFFGFYDLVKQGRGDK